MSAGGGDDAQVAVSVVVACRDAEAFIGQQLQALAEQSCPLRWELVIADNGSTDRTAEIVESYRNRVPRLVIVDASARIGPAAARNIGVARARGERIVLCDADDVVAPGWLAAMSAALERSGLVAARLEHELLNEAWSVSTRNPQPGLLQTDPPFLPYAFCAALGVRRSVYQQVGGLDETFLAGGEDRDFCYRVQLAGTPLELVPGAVVHYRHRATALDVYRQARGYARGHVRLYRDYRHLGLGRPSVSRAVVSWLLTPVKLIPALANHRRLRVWMGRLGWRVGRLQASLRYRVWAL